MFSIGMTVEIYYHHYLLKIVLKIDSPHVDLVVRFR